MSVSNEVLLDVQGLQKAYGSNQVLNGITTQIRRGEVVAIIGPSGCGKSTFLRSLNLLEEPTGGKILFEGTDITDPKVDINRHRQKIGMVFQQFNLFPHKTVKENIMLAPVTLKLMSKEEAEKKLWSFSSVSDFRTRQILIRTCFPVDRSSVSPLQDPLP